MSMAEQYYDIEYQCGNCLRGFLVYVPFQQEAPTRLRCPVCGLDRVNAARGHVEWINVYYTKDGRLVKRA